MRPSGADRAGQPRRARWFEVAAKNPMQGFCATRTQPRSFLFSDPGIGSTFDFSSRTVRNPGVAKASARRRSRTGKRQEVHVAARMGSVQLLARTDRDLPSSNRGRQAADRRWSALHWGALKGINGVVMVGGFCVVSKITAPAVGLFHHGARLRCLAGSCAVGLAVGICTKKALESDDSRARVVCYSAAGRRLRSRTARIPDSG